MELTELRSKEEVKEDIEASRRETKNALRDAKIAWVNENPAMIAWNQTKFRARQTQYAVSEKARTANCAVRSNIYWMLGGAALVGLAVGFFQKSDGIAADG